MITNVQNYIEVRKQRRLESKVDCRKQFSRGRLDSPLKHMKSRKTSTMMQLAKKGVCVFCWIYSGKNAHALFGQPKKRAMHIRTTRKSHFSSIQKAFLEMCKNQKCRTGHGEKEALLRWWAGCKLPTALWRSVWCFLKHLKNRATEHTALTLMYVYNWKTKIRQHTVTPKFRAALFTRTLTLVHLKYPRI